MIEYRDLTDCPTCPQLATDRDDALNEVDALRAEVAALREDSDRHKALVTAVNEATVRRPASAAVIPGAAWACHLGGDHDWAWWMTIEGVLTALRSLTAHAALVAGREGQ